MKIFAVLLSILIISGCASSSKDLTPTYVSPLQYQTYNCEQLAAEEQRLRVRVSELSGRIDDKADRDKLLVVIPYAVWFVGGNKEQEAEFSRLSGELDALQQGGILRNCVAPDRVRQ
jgi:outer membrane murein-binding lipoprotein Lpp